MQLLPVKINQSAIAYRPWKIKKNLIIGSGFAAAANLLYLVEAGIKPSQITIVGLDHLGTSNVYGCDDDFQLNARPIF